MSSDLPPSFGSNPYAAPDPQSFAPAPAVEVPYKEDQLGQPWAINYFGFVEMIQRNPGWLGNSFLSGICGIIPIVGMIVLWGYSYENAVTLHRTGGVHHVPFDFNRFGDYLKRGVGPFLVWLVFYVITQVFSVGFQAAGGIVAAAAGDNDAGAAAGGMLILFASLMIIPLSIAIALIQTPMMLRGGMTGDIGQAFNFNWALDFLKRCWLEMIVVWLVTALVSIPAAIISVLTCCIGIIPMIGLFALVNSWFSFQLYRVYLSKGGEPIPLKSVPLNFGM